MGKGYLATINRNNPNPIILMKIKFSLLLLTLIIISCNKDDDDVNPYLTDGFIAYEVAGDFNDYDLSKSGNLFVSTDYTDSYMYISGNNSFVVLTRMSSNLNSQISFEFKFDENDEYVMSYGAIDYDLYIEKYGNTVLYLNNYNLEASDATGTTPPLDNKPYFQFSNIVFSSDSKTISGDYYFYANSSYDTYEYTIQGSFQAQLYEYVH